MIGISAALVVACIASVEVQSPVSPLNFTHGDAWITGVNL